MDDLTSLHGLWQRCTGKLTGENAPARQQAQIRALYARGIFMDEALHFLFHQRPTFETFLA